MSVAARRMAAVLAALLLSLPGVAPAFAGPAFAGPAPTAGDAPVPPAVDAQGQLRDPALQIRFERISHDLRCLVCQNESVADSNAQLAADLRRQVREMLVAGKSDREIFDYMTDRYGEFVRFNTPLKGKTLLIWGAPFIMLVIGTLIVIRIARQRSQLPLDDEPTAN
jgi:cytochrome c-type biogenesis protein CcmH